MSPRRILVLRRRALGDLLVTLPVLRALRVAYPEARLTLLVDASLRAVAERAEADAVMLYPRAEIARGALWRRLATLRRFLRNLRAARFDLVLDLHGTPQTAFWSWWSRAALRVGRQRRWRSWAYNRLLPAKALGEGERFAGEVFLDWVRALGFDPGPWRPAPLRGVVRREAPRSSPRIVLNPSATWSAKAWPNEHWAELAQTLRRELQAELQLAWGPGEEAQRDEILSLAGGALDVLPATDIPALAQRLADADLVISGDSGPKHLAVNVGTPTLTLFGSTNPVGWQPPGESHRALFLEELSCRPCDLLRCPLDGHPCMTRLVPQTVVAAARELLHAAAGEDAS